MDKNPEPELPAWATRANAFIHGVREITEDTFDLLRQSGDAFFELRVELDANFDGKLAGCLHRLRLAAFEGAQLKFEVCQGLGGHFEPRTIIEFANTMATMGTLKVLTLSQLWLIPR